MCFLASSWNDEVVFWLQVSGKMRPFCDRKCHHKNPSMVSSWIWVIFIPMTYNIYYRSPNHYIWKMPHQTSIQNWLLWLRVPCIYQKHRYIIYIYSKRESSRCFCSWISTNLNPFQPSKKKTFIPLTFRVKAIFLHGRKRCSSISIFWLHGTQYQYWCFLCATNKNVIILELEKVKTETAPEN